VTRRAASRPARAAARRAAASRTARAAARRAAARRPARAAARRAAARRPAAKSAPRKATGGASKRTGDPVIQLVDALRDQLSNRVFEPRDLVVLASEVIQEAMDEAVERGRMTRGDANDLVGDLVRRGREQKDDVLTNLDQLLGKGIEQLEQLSKKLDGTAARARRADSVDRLLRSADRAARAVSASRRKKK
jgi:polyhydroxyalkanoate synthesis regulator phasin